MPNLQDLTDINTAAAYMTPALQGPALASATMSLQKIITAVSNGILEFLCRRLVCMTYVETRNGQGTQKMRTLQWPILNLASVQFVRGSAFSTAPTQAYVYDDKFITMLDGWNCWGFEDGAQNVVLTYTAGYITPGLVACNTLTPASRSTMYAASAQCNVNGVLYRCVVGGATAASAPVFNPVINSLTVDGTVTWLAQTGIPLMSPLASWIPEEIELACLQAVSLTYKNQTRVGDTSMGVGPDRVNYFLRAATQQTIEWLHPHRELFPIDGMTIQ